MAPIIKVLIADDHPIFLEGLKSCIESDPALQVIGKAMDGVELVEKAALLNPDVIVTDIMMPLMNGIDAIRAICEAGSPVACLAISTFNSAAHLRDAIKAGAKGYMVKTAGKEVITGIKEVYRNKYYYCRESEEKMLTQLTRTFQSNEPDPVYFSTEEINIIRYIAEGLSSQEIGKQIFKSKRTIDRMRSNLMSRMNAKTSAGMVAYAFKHNLLLPEEFNRKSLREDVGADE